MRDIDMVRTPGGYHPEAIGVNAEPTRPAKILLRMHALFGVGSQWRIAEPHIIIQIWRNRHFWFDLLPAGSVGRPTRTVWIFPMRPLRTSSQPVRNSRVRTLLAADLEDTALGFTVSLTARPSATVMERRFLDINSLPASAAATTAFRVPMVRRANGYRVNGRILQQLPEIAIGFDHGLAVPAFLFRVMVLDELLPVGHPLGIHVAYRDDASKLMFENAGQIHFVSDAAAADLADMDFFGSENLCRIPTKGQDGCESPRCRLRPSRRF